MTKEKVYIKDIPAVIWGEKSENAYIYVHGKLSNKESAEAFANIANGKAYQTISFDLPEHGERTDQEMKLDIHSGISDLNTIGEYAFKRWKNVSLFGNSIGAFFSLHAYSEIYFENCLFLAPIVNMDHLIKKMFLWFNVSEEILKEKREIPTPVETLSWEYYMYIKAHPIEKWSSKTHILYGLKDELQSNKVIDDFAKNFGSKLTVSENSEHTFMSPNDQSIVLDWLLNNI